MKKIANILLTVFAVGILAVLFAGALAALGYVAALFIGGETATALCLWIHKTYFPWVIQLASIFAGIGLVGMYLSKQKALTAASENINNAEK